MKKIISAILAGAVMCTSAVALAGCGGSKTESKTESTTAASSAASGSATADTPEGFVISQSPKAGTTVQTGDKVTINVASK